MYGDRAAEQHEKDQPSNQTCHFYGADGSSVGIAADGMCVNVYSCQERHDQLEALK